VQPIYIYNIKIQFYIYIYVCVCVRSYRLPGHLVVETKTPRMRRINHQRTRGGGDGAPISPVGGAIIFGTSVCAIRVILAIVCVCGAYPATIYVLGSRHNNNNNIPSSTYNNNNNNNNIFSCFVCGGDYTCVYTIYARNCCWYSHDPRDATLPRWQILIVYRYLAALAF